MKAWGSSLPGVSGTTLPVAVAMRVLQGAARSGVDIPRLFADNRCRGIERGQRVEELQRIVPVQVHAEDVEVADVHHSASDVEPSDVD